MPEPRKSADLRAIESGGRVRARFADETGVDADSGPLGGPPGYLSHDQRGMWKELQGRIAPGVLMQSDSLRFSQLVIAATVERELLREWNANGCPVLVPPKKKGAAPHQDPVYAQLQSVRRQMAPMLAEFGLNPRDRARVKVPKAKAANPLDKFTRGKAA